MTENPRIGAVLLAGGHVPASLAHLCTHRALLRVGDRYLLEYVTDTLRQVPAIIDLALVAQEEALLALQSLPGAKVAAGNTIVENMQLGARALAQHDLTHIVYITGDIPLLTAEGMVEYIAQSLDSNAALTYPIIPRDACDARFPGAKRTYVKIKEGTFTGGNIIFTQAALLDHKQDLILGLYNARKDPLKLAGLLGWATILKMLTGTLTIPYLEQVASRILAAPVRAIITRHAEIGFDVDKAEDLVAVEQALGEVKS